MPASKRARHENCSADGTFLSGASTPLAAWTVSAIPQTPFVHDPYYREVYSVEGVHVILDDYGTWHCECPACPPGAQCTHIVQARRFKQMRGRLRSQKGNLEVEIHAAGFAALRSESPAVCANDLGGDR
jgi:hypothetical protein